VIKRNKTAAGYLPTRRERFAASWHGWRDARRGLPVVRVDEVEAPTGPKYVKRLHAEAAAQQSMLVREWAAAYGAAQASAYRFVGHQSGNIPGPATSPNGSSAAAPLSLEAAAHIRRLRKAAASEAAVHRGKEQARVRFLDDWERLVRLHQEQRAHAEAIVERANALLNCYFATVQRRHPERGRLAPVMESMEIEVAVEWRHTDLLVRLREQHRIDAEIIFRALHLAAPDQPSSSPQPRRTSEKDARDVN
jgi:hypothetical protein